MQVHDQSYQQHGESFQPKPLEVCHITDGLKVQVLVKHEESSLLVSQDVLALETEHSNGEGPRTSLLRDFNKCINQQHIKLLKRP